MKILKIRCCFFTEILIFFFGQNILLTLSVPKDLPLFEESDLYIENIIFCQFLSISRPCLEKAS